MSAQQQNQKPVFRVEFLPEIELDNFQIDGNKLLIHCPDASKPVQTTSGLSLSEKTEGEVRESVLTVGEIVSVGPGVINTEYKVGTTVFFYRGHSQGAFRTGQVPLFVYEEYSIFGHLKVTPPKASTILIGQA